MKVHFHYIDRKIPIKNKKEIRAFIEYMMKREGFDCTRLDYIFCSDDYLLTINREFLKHDSFTDIVTFDFSEHKGMIIGEIYISVDRVMENALIFNATRPDEFLRVIFHGALHLCGYGDKKRADIVVMREKEDYYIKRFHVEHKKSR